MDKRISTVHEQIRSFERKQIIASFMGLLFLIGSSFFINRVVMLGAAEHTSRLITRLSQVTDFRDLSMTLQDAHLDYFSKIQYQSKSLNRSFTIPALTEFEQNESFWHSISYGIIEWKIANFNGEKEDQIVFEYNRFNYCKHACLIWILLCLVSLPQTRIMKRRIVTQYERELNLQKKFFESKQEVERFKVYELLSKQVAHDIRSPLSALYMVASNLKEVSEEKRILIRNATQRINDIANDLLQKSHNQESQLKKTLGHESACGENQETHRQLIEFLPTLIDMLVSEKRMQFRDYNGIEIETDFRESFGSFAKVNRKELQRLISNLINNSVEAFPDKKGKILVGIRKINKPKNSQVEIFVQNNGKGIPHHILAQLGDKGITYGKQGTSSGSGLGIYHAKKTIELFGGKFLIESKERQGTSIRIILPLTETPSWFAHEINVTNTKYLVTLDDDSSIHQIWAERINGLNDLEHLRFQSGANFEKYVQSHIDRNEESFFLVDYELLNQPKNGLQIISDLEIANHSIIVTSRYEEAELQEKSNELKFKILPKSLAGFVPLKGSRRF